MPEIAESILFPGVREGMTKLFKVSSLEDIRKVDELTLPDPFLNTVVEKTEQTLNDFHERSASLVYEGNQFMVKDEELGTDFDFQTWRAVGADYSFFSNLHKVSKIYFGRPILTYYHTHPYFSEDLLVKKGYSIDKISFTLKDKEITYSVSVAEFNSMINTLVSYPSREDLMFFLSNQRFSKTMMISGKWGIKFIVNPDVNIPWVTLTKKPTQKVEEAFEFLPHYLNANKDVSEALPSFNEGTKNALQDFCRENNFLYFKNDDFRSPILKREV